MPPKKKKKKTLLRREPRMTMPFAVSKRKQNESFEVSPPKRAKNNYIIISDSDDSSSAETDDDDNEDYHIEKAKSSTTATQADDNDSDSDTGSCIIVDSRPIAGKEEVVTQGRKLDDLFKKIPIEVHQNIAMFLPSDTDITRYSRVGKSTYSAISDSVWRYRFLEKFDAPLDASVALLREKYQFRRRTTRFFTRFDLKDYKFFGKVGIRGVQEAQKNCLDMLQNLIIESDAHKDRDDNGDEVIVSRNLDYIRNYVSFVPGTDQTGNLIDIIDSICKTDNDWNLYTVCSVNCPSDSNTLLLLIQLCLTSISWDPRYCKNTISHFDLSQFEVYASPAKQPLFVGKWKNDLNVRWCLHAANFFKFHLKAGKGEGLLAHAYSDLPGSQLPQPWLGRLKSGTQQLGSHWKGAYCFLHPDGLARMREAGDDTDSGPYSDELDGGESFQDISLFFDDQKFGKQHWVKSWEKILQSDPFSNAVPESTHGHGSRRITRSRIDCKKSKEIPNPGVKYFHGSSRDSSTTAHFYGAVHGIPLQHGIPGFQRITIMKFFPDENGNFDRGQSWGYEGCVLPGGRIIIGRWFDARSDSDMDDVMSGPFVFWNVDESEAVEPIDGKEALEFFELMKLHGHV
ncbi:hypothetical protein SBOR_3338 [Sclerotinia borealis F-4128]|uniref:F-box domain-containing protein n=1 Tax=Sclerotinia borealis (strain F-4128) TaxID=1432307 RepID=W9CJW4_SCLBF|nr:hypothetical protein SBOR_3338 [Sclerotinia borealis F-4128]